MPGGDGFEAIDRFKKEFPKTRILVMSGDSKLTRTDYLAAAELMGVDATLRKPFAPDALLETLKRLTS